LRKHQTAVKAFFVMISTLVMGLLLPSLLAFFSALMTNPMTWVILALVALAAVIEDLIVWMDGGESALDKFWSSLFGDPETAKKNIEEIKEKFSAFVDGVMFFLDELASGRAWQRMKDNASTAIQRIKDRWQTFMRDMRGKWERFKRDVKAPFERIGQAIEELKARWDTFVIELQTKWDNTTDSITNTWQWVKDTIAEGWQWIKNKCQEALDWVIKKWNEMSATATSALNSLLGPIQSIASWIYEYIGGAIDWALEKWNALKSIVGGGEVFVNHELTAAYAGAAIGGGSTTNNNSSSTNYNISVGSVYSNNPKSFVNGLVPQSNGGYRG
jgi:hypothetical protein